ncbi:hypothetical protein APSETT444_000001 [Aspergillus pseudonomiae]
MSNPDTIVSLLGLNAVIIEHEMLPVIMQEIIAQILSKEYRFMGTERALTAAACGMVVRILEDEGIDLKQIKTELAKVSVNFTFTAKEAAVFLGILYGGMFKFISNEDIEHSKRVDRAKLITSLIFDGLGLAKPAKEVVDIIKTGAEYAYDQLKEEQPTEIINESIEHFLLESVTYPLIKAQQISALGIEFEEDDVHVFFLWFRATLASCGFKAV